MDVYLKKAWALVLIAGLVVVACDSGTDQESKYAKIFSELNEDWSLYEIVQQGNMTVIRVEVTDVVPFKEAKKALAAIQKDSPKLEGYIEFYNSEVGMVLRKVEIIPEGA